MYRLGEITEGKALAAEKMTSLTTTRPQRTKEPLTHADPLGARNMPVLQGEKAQMPRKLNLGTQMNHVLNAIGFNC